MSEENKPPSYQKEAAEILGIAKNLRGKVENVEELASNAISEGKTADEFRRIALNKLPEIKPLEKPILADVKPKEWRNYSITRAIMDQAEGRLSGFERELSDEMSTKLGRRPEGFWLPGEALVSRAEAEAMGGTTITANTLGGVLAIAQNLYSEFIEVLRNKTKVLSLGARVLNLAAPVSVPRQYTAGTPNWVGETVASTLTDIGLQPLTLTPYAISSNQVYSKQLLATGNPSIDALVRDDMIATMAIAIDKAAIHGSGSGQPTGIVNTTGINSVSANITVSASGLAATLYPFLVSLETEVAVDNADLGSLAYLMRPKERGACKTVVKFASTGVTNWEPGNTVNGYRAEATNQIVSNLTSGTATTICSAIIFGNWSELLVAQFNNGATDMVVDPYTLAANGCVRLCARRWVDIGVRHPVSFCVGGSFLA